MTRVQYHRAVAAQNQSKAGDQWSFFQAKRVRGTTLEMAIQQLRAQFGRVPVSADDLQRVSQLLVEVLSEANKPQAGAKEDNGKSTEGKFAKQLAQARALQKKMQDTLAKAEKEKAFSYLNTGELPLPEGETLKDNPIVLIIKEAATFNKNIPDANTIAIRKIKEVEVDGKKRSKEEFADKTEWEAATRKVMKPITANQIAHAIERAEQRLKRFEDLSGPREKVYREHRGVARSASVPERPARTSPEQARQRRGVAVAAGAGGQQGSEADRQRLLDRPARLQLSPLQPRGALQSGDGHCTACRCAKVRWHPMGTSSRAPCSCTACLPPRPASPSPRLAWRSGREERAVGPGQRCRRDSPGTGGYVFLQNYL